MVAIGCSIHSAAILSWYTVASGMVAVVVKFATVLLSGCNSSCSRLQYTVLYSTELRVYFRIRLMEGQIADAKILGGPIG